MYPTTLLQKVWFVTGCSSGLGRQIVHKALSRNDRVIATARSLESIKDLESDSCRILQLDVTDDTSVIQRTAAEALGFWSRVDVLVNNAGGGLFGFTEEISPEAYLRHFYLNFFGHLNVTNAFLPQMRERKHGIVVFIGSRSSYRTHIPMTGAYVASKAALSAVADTFAAEVEPFNIRVLNVIPGALRTEAWNSARVVHASPETRSTPSSETNKQYIEDYDIMRKQGLDGLAQLKRKTDEAGDPGKAAQAIVDVVRGEGMGLRAREKDGWPSLLVLGEDGEKDVRLKCEKILKTLDEWKEVSMSIA